MASLTISDLGQTLTITFDGTETGSASYELTSATASDAGLSGATGDVYAPGAITRIVVDGISPVDFTLYIVAGGDLTGGVENTLGGVGLNIDVYGSLDISGAQLVGVDQLSVEQNLTTDQDTDLGGAVVIQDGTVLTDQVLVGTDDSENLTGGDGNDTLEGLGGFDYLDGGAGNDSLDGGLDGDYLVAGPGDDTLTIGTYNFHHDSVEIDGNSNDVITDWRVDQAHVNFSQPIPFYQTPEDVVAAAYQSGDDVIIPLNVIDPADAGNPGAPRYTLTLQNFQLDQLHRWHFNVGDYLAGTEGDDNLTGGPGDDNLIGFGGSDTLDGGPGADYFEGGAGPDRFVFDRFDHWEHVNDFNPAEGDVLDLSGTQLGLVDAAALLAAANDDNSDGVVINTNDGGLFLFGMDLAALTNAIAAYPDNFVFGQPVPGQLFQGTEGGDDLHGTEGGDTLLGVGGDDGLWANGGDDILEGGPGSDHLNGGPGNDTLTGGADIDNFYIDITQQGHVTITDFSPADEIIDIFGFSQDTDPVPFITTGVEQNGNVVFTFSADTSLTIEGITLADLNAEFSDDIQDNISAIAFLQGTDGNDILVTSGARVDMEGGAGADVFQIDGLQRWVAINDFEPGIDTIDLSNSEVGLIDFDAILDRAEDDGFGNVNINIDGDYGSLQLRNTSLSDLNASDFLFGLPFPPQVIVGTDADEDFFDWSAEYDFPGNDTIDGGGGNDGINAGPGDDVVIGGTGFDFLDGGDGNDTLTGGSEGDTFYLNIRYGGHDVVTDFNPDQDNLLFADFDGPAFVDAILAAATTSGSDVVFTFGDTSMTVQNTVISDFSANNLRLETRVEGTDEDDILFLPANQFFADGLGGNDTYVISDITGYSQIYNFDTNGDIVDFSNTNLGLVDLDAVLSLAVQQGPDIRFDINGATFILQEASVGDLSDANFIYGGQIPGYADTSVVFGPGDATSFTNTGDIERRTTANDDFAVTIDNDGDFTLDNQGLITGGGNNTAQAFQENGRGVYFEGDGTLTLTNAQGATIDGGRFGVLSLDSAGGNTDLSTTLIDNAGLISAGDDAIRVRDGRLTLTNSGTIRGEGDAWFDADGNPDARGSDGISAFFNGDERGILYSAPVIDVTNTATGVIDGFRAGILGGDGSMRIDNAGYIEGGDSGILVSTGNPVFGNTYEITNSGTIAQVNDGPQGLGLSSADEQSAILVYDGGYGSTTITNTTTGIIEAANHGFMLYTPVTLVNDGTITADTDADGVGVAIFGGVEEFLSEEAVTAGVTLADSVTNTGTITGDIFLNDGDDVFTNSGTVVGTTDMGNGNDLYDGSAGSAGHLVLGGAGNDMLTGGAGADTLDGGTGNDSLTGGGGADRFLVGADQTVIADLSTGDIVDLSSTSLADADFSGILAAATADAGGVDIVHDSGTLRLEGLSSLDLTPQLFGLNLDNTAPEGTASTQTAVEDTAFVVTAAHFGFTDSDAGDTLFAVRIDSTLQGLALDGTQTANGQVIAAGDIASGLLTYTPPLDVNGSAIASFDFSVSDGSVFSAAPATMTFDVLAANDPPIAVDASVTTPETQQRYLDLLPSDTDVDGDSLSIALGTDPSFGTVTVANAETGVVLFQPTLGDFDLYEGESLTESVGFTVSDGTGLVDAGTLTITVEGEGTILPVADADIAEAEAGALVGQLTTIAGFEIAAGDQFFLSDDRFTVSETGEVSLRLGTVPDSVLTTFAGLFPDLSTAELTEKLIPLFSPALDYEQETEIDLVITRVRAVDNQAETITIHINVLDVTNVNAQDGYIAGALVFADANGNGEFDLGEVVATTDGAGDFELGDDAQGTLILQGGINPLTGQQAVDISTGVAFNGRLTAPDGSTVLTPLTTLISELAGDGATDSEIADAEAKVSAALGLDDAIDLTSFDPILSALTEDDPDAAADAAAVYAAGTQILNTVVLASSAVEGIDADASTDADDGAIATIAGAIDDLSGGETLDLTDTAIIDDVIDGAASRAGAGLVDDDVRAAAAGVIAAVNQASQDALDDPTTPIEDALVEVTKVATVAQGDAADAVEQAAEDGNADAVTDTFVDALDDAIATTTVGTLEPGRVITGTDAADSLTGLGGDDTLRGLGGADTLTGGGGADIFVIGSGGSDTVTDFDPSSDRIDLSEIGMTGLGDVQTDGDGTVIALDGGEALTLAGITDALSDDVFIFAVNAAPDATGGSIETDPGVPVILTLEDIGYSDPEGDVFVSLTIQSLPVGDVRLGDTLLDEGDVVTAADIAAGLLTFTSSDSGISDLDFTVSDGNSNSGTRGVTLTVTGSGGGDTGGDLDPETLFENYSEGSRFDPEGRIINEDGEDSTVILNLGGRATTVVVTEDTDDIRLLNKLVEWRPHKVLDTDSGPISFADAESGFGIHIAAAGGNGEPDFGGFQRGSRRKRIDVLDDANTVSSELIALYTIAEMGGAVDSDTDINLRLGTVSDSLVEIIVDGRGASDVLSLQGELASMLLDAVSMDI